MEIARDLLELVLCLTAFGTLLCAGLLFLRRACGDRSRLLLAWCFAFCGAVVAFRVWTVNIGWPVSDEVLLPSDLDSGLLTLLVFFLYPIEVIHPGWLDLRRITVLLLPWIVFGILWILVPFRPLTSFPEMLASAGEFNVWIRLLFLSMFVPMCFVLYSIPRNWAQSSADNRWIRLYTVGTQGISVLYLLSMLTGNALVNALHIAYCMGFCLAVTYQEVFLRLRVPVEERDTPQVASAYPPPRPGLPSYPTLRSRIRCGMPCCA